MKFIKDIYGSLINLNLIEVIKIRTIVKILEPEVIEFMVVAYTNEDDGDFYSGDFYSLSKNLETKEEAEQILEKIYFKIAYS